MKLSVVQGDAEFGLDGLRDEIVSKAESLDADTIRLAGMAEELAEWLASLRLGVAISVKFRDVSPATNHELNDERDAAKNYQLIFKKAKGSWALWIERHQNGDIHDEVLFSESPRRLRFLASEHIGDLLTESNRVATLLADTASRHVSNMQATLAILKERPFQDSNTRRSQASVDAGKKDATASGRSAA